MSTIWKFYYSRAFSFFIAWRLDKYLKSYFYVYGGTHGSVSSHVGFKYLTMFISSTQYTLCKGKRVKVAYSRSPNIKDMIIKTEIIKQYTPKISQPCFKPKCRTCLQMDNTQTITNRTNHSYPIRGKFNCHSTNIVYVLKCMICGIQYVGESSKTMNTSAEDMSAQ